MRRARNRARHLLPAACCAILAACGPGARDAADQPDAGPAVPDGPCVGKVASGSHHVCALAWDGGVWCLGMNTAGGLGDGTTEGREAPVRVLGLPRPAVALDAGGLHSCAVLDDGSLWCWGANSYGQLGRLPLEMSFEPVRAPLDEPVIDVATGGGHTCAVTDAGEILCWGANVYGELGRGTRHDHGDPQPAPVALAGGREVAAGYGFTCARLSDGTVWCWGDNYGGQLGDGVFIGHRTEPVRALEIDDATAVEAGLISTCAIRTGGSLWCWGAPLWSGGRPADTGLVRVIDVGSGPGELCVLQDDGTVRCAGTQPPYEPEVVTDLPSTVLSVTSLTFATCVAGSDGALWCWGRIDLDDEERFVSSTPHRMGSLCPPEGS